MVEIAGRFTVVAVDIEGGCMVNETWKGKAYERVTLDWTSCNYAR